MDNFNTYPSAFETSDQDFGGQAQPFDDDLFGENEFPDLPPAFTPGAQQFPENFDPQPGMGLYEGQQQYGEPAYDPQLYGQPPVAPVEQQQPSQNNYGNQYQAPAHTRQQAGRTYTPYHDIPPPGGQQYDPYPQLPSEQQEVYVRMPAPVQQQQQPNPQANGRQHKMPVPKGERKASKSIYKSKNTPKAPKKEAKPSKKRALPTDDYEETSGRPQKASKKEAVDEFDYVPRGTATRHRKPAAFNPTKEELNEIEANYAPRATASRKAPKTEQIRQDEADYVQRATTSRKAPKKAPKQEAADEDESDEDAFIPRGRPTTARSTVAQKTPKKALKQEKVEEIDETDYTCITNLTASPSATSAQPSRAYFKFMEDHLIFIIMRFATVCVGLCRIDNAWEAEILGQWAVDFFGKEMFDIAVNHYIKVSKDGDEFDLMKPCMADCIGTIKEGPWDQAVAEGLQENVIQCGLWYQQPHA